MNTPIVVTKEAITEWVMKQPDDRKVNMNQVCYNSNCGCLMVQYGKENFKEPFSAVGFYSWMNYENDISTTIAILEKDIYDIVGFAWECIETFKDLKKEILNN